MKAAGVPERGEELLRKEKEMNEKTKVSEKAPNASSLRLEESALSEGTVISSRSRATQWCWLN